MKNKQEIYSIIENLHGYLSFDVFDLFSILNRTIKFNRANILEIGVFCGRSLLGLAAAFPGAKIVVGVDPFYEDFFNSPADLNEAKNLARNSQFLDPEKRIEMIYEITKKVDLRHQLNIRRRLKLKKQTQEEFLKENKKKYSILHVDGEHTFEAVNSIIKEFNKILNFNSIIIIDDILNPGYPCIAEAVFSNRVYKKDFFPLIFAFNKGVFIYKPKKIDFKLIVNKITNYFSRKNMQIRKMKDGSAVIFQQNKPYEDKLRNLKENISFIKRIKEVFGSE